MRQVCAAIIMMLAVISASCGSPQAPGVDMSHVEANVPAADQFDAALRRDLLAHFSSLSSIRVTSVDATLLREKPTQSGVAYPKYYAWVVLRSDSGQTRSGAVRVAAVNATRFEVTHFLSKEVLQADPAAASEVFPAALVDDVNKRASE